MAEVKLEALTVEALRKALRFHDRVRLRSAKASANSLLVGAASSAAVNAAEEQCRDKALGLIAIEMVSETVRKKTSNVAYARITPHGIERLLKSLTPDEYAASLDNCHPAHAEALKAGMLPALTSKLQELDHQREALLRDEEELLDAVRKLVSDRRSQLDKESQAKARREEALSGLAEFIKTGKRPDPDKPPKPGRKIPPATEMEVDFQRRICIELAEELKDSPQSRDAIERAFYIVDGMTPVGEVGETVKFDGSEHQSTDPLYPDDPAVVTQRGWRYEAPGGEVLQLVRATVEAKSDS